MKALSITRINSLLVPLIFLLVSLQSISQESRQNYEPNWSVNLNAGPSLFYGDIENYRFYKSFENNSEWKFGYGLIIQKTFSPVFTLRGQLLSSELSGTKRKVNKWFVADIIETSLSTKVNLSNLLGGTKNRTISIYGMAGLGFSQWKTQLMDLNSNETIYGNGNNTGSGINGRTLEAVVPFGVGADIRINEKWEVSIEGSLRPVNSDLLDANQGGFQYDFYSYNFVGITYKFTKKKSKISQLPPPNIIADVPVNQTEVSIPDEELAVVASPEVLETETIDEQLRRVESRGNMYEETWKGVRFRVQIAASKTQMEISEIAKKYSLDKSTLQEVKSGEWFTYSTGNFNKFWKAKEYCNLLVSRNHIYDAFVVAFRNESKIKLEELLADNSAIPDEKLINNQSNFFGVQILATTKNKYATEAIQSLFGLEEVINIDQSTTLTRYIAGEFDTKSEAENLLDQMNQKGIKDAFIVQYKNGIRQ
jgi:hypothetical protein